MRSLLFGAAVAAIFMAPQLAAQGKTAKQRQEERLVPVETPWNAFDSGNAGRNQPFDPDAWRLALQEPDLDRREASLDRLVALARRSAEARAALKEWARDGSDAQLAWTSRLALREIERASHPFAGFPTLGQPFSSHPFGADRWLDLEQWMDQMLQQRGIQGFGPTPFLPGDAHRQSQSFELQSTPDGVKIETREMVNGQEQVKTYEADSMEELLEAHPELRASILPRRGLAPDWTPLRSPMSARPRVLGVMLREPGQFDAPEGVEPGVGLLVVSVLPGTMAEAMGVRQGDVLLEMNGTALHGADDVRRVLSRREADEEVRLTLVGADGAQKTVTWKPPRDKRRSA